MDLEIKSSETSKPLAGWACLAIGIGFILSLAILLTGVRWLGGA